MRGPHPPETPHSSASPRRPCLGFRARTWQPAVWPGGGGCPSESPMSGAGLGLREEGAPPPALWGELLAGPAVPACLDRSKPPPPDSVTYCSSSSPSPVASFLPKGIFAPRRSTSESGTSKSSGSPAPRSLQSTLRSAAGDRRPLTSLSPVSCCFSGWLGVPGLCRVWIRFEPRAWVYGEEAAVPVENVPRVLAPLAALRGDWCAWGHLAPLRALPPPTHAGRHRALLWHPAALRRVLLFCSPGPRPTNFPGVCARTAHVL